MRLRFPIIVNQFSDMVLQCLTCIAGVENGRRYAGISEVAMPRILRLAEQMQHHADEPGQHGDARGDAQQRGQIRAQLAEIYGRCKIFRLKFLHIIT